MELMEIRRGLMAQMARNGLVTQIGYAEIAQGDETYIMKISLPADWSQQYDMIVGYGTFGTAVKSWLYNSFSTDAAIDADGYISSAAGILYPVGTLIYKYNSDFYYKNLSSTPKIITPGTSDFITLRAYQTNRLLPGSNYTVYGIKA